MAGPVTAWRKRKRSMGAQDRARRRRSVRARDGDSCCYCTRTMAFDGDPLAGLFATLEHVRRWAKNGTNAIENLKLACKKCNELMGMLHDPCRTKRSRRIDLKQYFEIEEGVQTDEGQAITSAIFWRERAKAHREAGNDELARNCEAAAREADKVSKR